MDPRTLEPADLLYLCLHGRPSDPFLYGNRDIPVLDLDRVARLHLHGALVYLAGCHGAGRPAEAFLAAGAAAIVADADLAWAGRFLPLGSQALGRAWVRHLAAGMAAGQALDVAKKAFADRHGALRDREMLDTVRIYGDGRARA